MTNAKSQFNFDGHFSENIIQSTHLGAVRYAETSLDDAILTA